MGGNFKPESVAGLIQNLQYKENYSKQASYESLKKYCIENFKQYFGEETKLSNIRYVDIETYRNHLKQKLTQHGTIRADATVNREMTVLSHIFSKAVVWKMMEKSPFDEGESLLYKLSNKRTRFLDGDEIIRLLEECRPKEHLYWIVMCALNPFLI